MTAELNSSSRSTLQIQNGCRYTITSEACPSRSLCCLCSKLLWRFPSFYAWRQISMSRSSKVGKDSIANVLYSDEPAYWPASFVYSGELSRSMFSWNVWNVRQLDQRRQVSRQLPSGLGFNAVLSRPAGKYCCQSVYGHNDAFASFTW